MTLPEPNGAYPVVPGDRYRIVRLLGEGGMARVYLAHDVKHGRDVAIKVIRAELAASLGRDRFLREIAIAARLRHPNIVPLFDSGDADGVLYFVMPYEEGPSLGTRLAGGAPLPISDAVSVMRDVARALQYAHGHGVVHRDIKPDNVILSGGAAVVADFGIAKAVSAAQSATTGNTITHTGAGIGTPAYMAPEQAVGDPSSDHRADIYSYGCLAYELLTGKPPFPELSTHQIIAAHMTTVPRPVNAVRTEVPSGVVQLIAQCLAKEPEDRPQTATQILSALDGDAMAASRVVGAAVATAAPARSRARLWTGGGAVVALAVAAWFLTRESATPPTPITVAVLPIGNIGGDSALLPSEFGLADEVFSALERVQGVEMRSRNGAKAYAGRLGVDEREVGKKLQVDYVVEGDMREEKGRWRVNARLTRTVDATEIWSQLYTVDPQQQLSVAGDIANGAAAALRRKFPHVLGQALAPRPKQTTTSSEAHRLYVLGEERLSRRGLSMQESAERFREAIRLDSNYAEAHAGLSMALALFPYFEHVPGDEVAAELTASAQRALRLDSTLALPHVALGLANEHRYRFDAAGAEFREAIRLGPTDVEAHVQYGRHLLVMLRADEALNQFQLARKEDPASALVLSWVSYAFFLLGRRDSARVFSAQALQDNELNPSAVNLGARILLADGLRDSARALFRRFGREPDPYLLSMTGDSALARKEIDALRQKLPRASAGFAKEALFGLGIRDTAIALSALERATDVHDIWPVMVPSTDPMFDPVRASPRFLVVLKRVGLPMPPASVSRGPRAP